MKRFFMLIIALLMLCSCNVQEEPVLEEEPDLNDTYAKHKDAEITKGKMDDVFLTVTGKTLVGGGENE